MNVEHILSGKGREVTCARPDNTLHEVAKMMSEKGIGAIVVSSGEGLITGIISERDIMRTIAAFGARALDDRVSSHMTTNVITCKEHTTIQQLMEQMTRGRFRHMPVVENNRLCGMISIGDLVKNRLAEMEAEQDDLKRYIATA